MLRTEEEVNELIEEMVRRSSGRYITQGVSFNKTCPRQMGLLKKALMASASFSGLIKELLAVKFDEREQTYNQRSQIDNTNQSGQIEEHRTTKAKNIGNFL